MRFEDYEKRYAVLYAEYAAIVKLILEKAIVAASGVPLPQSIQCRAKSPLSLQRKLSEGRFIESDNIESVIKDLAGVRLIFYTNTDVDRFLNSRLIPGNFAVDYDSTKVHHPVKENDGVRYRAIHHLVGLNEQRLGLPEYAKFNGMRCEIQIHTILNHAWSETSHDIIYKERLPEGFGSKAMASLKKRFDQIMDKYLLPAGYEFQRAQHDYERLRQGKALFDRDAIQTIRGANNNNERCDLLATLKDHVLPNYDDLPAVYRDISDALLEVAKAARVTPLEPIKTAFGNFEGKTTADVVKAIVDIFTKLRYVEVERTFLALCDLYEDEADLPSQENILEAVKQLAHHDIEVWRQVGPQVQLALVQTIEGFTSERRVALRKLLITVWSEVLDSDLTGTSWSADSVTLSRAAIPTSAELQTAREKSLKGLFDAFIHSSTDIQRKEVLAALRQATQIPTSVPCPDQFLAMSLSDAKLIVDFLTQQSAQQSHELLEYVEHHFLLDYHRARSLASDASDKRGCRAVAQSLMASIEVFRDQVNSDKEFTKYKVLVGFESVLPPAWDDEDFEFDGADTYRRQRVEEYLLQISDDNEEEWYQFIERCAATESNDGATFQIFHEFLDQLSHSKPAVAARFLNRASSNLLNFLPAFLGGLKKSNASSQYDAAIRRFMKSSQHLSRVALHFRSTPSTSDALIEELVTQAIATSNDVAVIECLSLVMERGEKATKLLVEKVFTPAIQYLIAKKDTRWVRYSLLRKECKAFVESRTKAQIELILEGLVPLPRIDHYAERVLGWIADKNPADVWHFFGRRLDDHRESEGLRYEAVPFRLHGLDKILCRDADLGVSIVRGWRQANPELFRYRGGRLLKAVFAELPEPFVLKLKNVASESMDEDVEFILGILDNFEGEVAIHPILQELICRIPDGDERLSAIEFTLEHTGMVSGAFGFVEAYRRKKDEVASWCDDPRPRVSAFALNYMRKLDRRIASEQRTAEQRQEQRKRDFDNNDEE